MARWLQVLGTYDFEVEHRAGKSHGNADAMSRGPCKQCGREATDMRVLMRAKAKEAWEKGVLPEEAVGEKEPGNVQVETLYKGLP